MIQHFTRLKNRLFSILVLTTLSYNISVAQQYTITDDDVVVENGVIKSCSYNFEIKDIIIPEILDGQVVKSINISPDPENDTEPFGFCRRGLKSVKLPGTLISIGKDAFMGNELSDIVIPDGVTTIGRYAFYRSGIKVVKIPNSVTEIAGDAFAMNELESVVIPDGIEVIECNTFRGNKLTEVILPKQLKKIESSAFSYNNLSTIDLPESLIKIGSNAFRRNKLSSVEIPKNIKVLYPGVFGQNLLKEVTLPEGLIAIRWSAFADNLIESIKLPTTLNRIEETAFYSNSSLEYIVLPKPNGDLKFKGWTDYYGNKYAANDRITDFRKGYSAIIEYTLTDDDVVVEEGIIKQVDYNLQVTSITIPSVLDGQIVVGIDDGVIYSDEYISYAKGVFSDKCLINVKLPEKLEVIGEYAFSDNQLLDIDIPETVTNVKNGAFVYNKLSSINFSDNLKIIGSDAFGYNRLESIVIPDNVISIGGNAFNHNKLSRVKISERITSIERNTFSNNKLTNIVIPSNIIEIKSGAFAHNELTSVDIPSSVQYIGKVAFCFNMNLDYIELPMVSKNGASFSGWKNENGDIISGGTRVTDLETPYEAIVSDLNTNQIVLFPNPVSYELTVSSGSEIKKIEICTIQGKVIITKHINKQTTAYLDVNALSSGVYIVKVTHGNSSKSLRMVKQ
jgi:hypothetical protein